jgi:hypothetical protein
MEPPTDIQWKELARRNIDLYTDMQAKYFKVQDSYLKLQNDYEVLKARYNKLCASNVRLQNQIDDMMED